jgi:hypothetical protein
MEKSSRVLLPEQQEFVLRELVLESILGERWIWKLRCLQKEKCPRRKYFQKP